MHLELGTANIHFMSELLLMTTISIQPSIVQIITKLHILCFLLCFDGRIPPYTNHRGIRQGDPLSPIHFYLVMDNRSRLIEKEVKEKRMDTYMVNGATSISHLIYVDQGDS